MARSEIEWNVGDVNMTCLRGTLDLMAGDFDKTVDRLEALGAMPVEGDTVEFWGRYNGAVFTLYDYYGSRKSLNIGGHAPGDGKPVLDVEGLKTHLANWFALPAVLDMRTHLWPRAS